jgi:plasmid stabilization system protein ParE
MIGRPGRVANTCELVVHPNYILIYDIVGEMIRVIRTLHAAQQWRRENP